MNRYAESKGWLNPGYLTDHELVLRLKEYHKAVNEMKRKRVPMVQVIQDLLRAALKLEGR